MAARRVARKRGRRLRRRSKRWRETRSPSRRRSRVIDTLAASRTRLQADSGLKSAWDPQFFKRTDLRADPAVPALAWLESVPDEVEAEILATIDAVAVGPPPQFRGGLRYQPMHGDMSGWFEARTKYQKRLYRLFCLQDRKAPGLPRPALVMVTGGDKPTESAFSKAFYKKVRALGDEYLASDPRNVA